MASLFLQTQVKCWVSFGFHPIQNHSHPVSTLKIIIIIIVKVSIPEMTAVILRTGTIICTNIYEYLSSQYAAANSQLLHLLWALVPYKLVKGVTGDG